jgi:Bacterial regulatory proteins, luxR family
MPDKLMRLRRSEPAPPRPVMLAIAGDSEETVKTHSRGIYRKLGVSDRAGAVAVALREGVFH